MRFQLPNVVAMVRHPHHHPLELSYLNGFSYGIGMSMLSLLVPLYIIRLGFSLADMGLVVSSAAVFMIVLRLLGGAVSDRFGERVVLWFSFATLVGCALVFVVSETILPFIVAQVFNGMSRAVYWSAGQSYTSRSSEGDSHHTQGRLLSFESSGGILGVLIGGAVAEVAGFPAAFMATAAVNVVGIFTTLAQPALPRKDQVRSIRATLAPARRLLVQKSMGLGHYAAIMSAAHAALVGSLFAAFFVDIGYGDATVSLMRGLNSVGVVLVAYPFGALLAIIGTRNMAVAGLAMIGAVTALMTLTADVPFAPGVFMLLGGVAFGSLRSLYPVVAAQNSTPQERGQAMAVVGLYWAVGMLIVPFAFGLIGDAIGIRPTLYLFSGIAVGAALMTPLLAYWWREQLTVGAIRAPRAPR